MADELEELYQSTYTAVVRYLYRKVWDADRAEDLAQEVFMRLLAHRPEKPRAWIFAVAANLARDEARAAIRRRRHLVLMQSEPGVMPSRTRDAEEQVEDDEQCEQVKVALGTLSSGPGSPAAVGRRNELSGDCRAVRASRWSNWHDARPRTAPTGRGTRTPELS